MKEKITPYPLRMPSYLREWLSKSSIDNGRSLHSEIIFRLKKEKEEENQKTV